MPVANNSLFNPSRRLILAAAPAALLASALPAAAQPGTPDVKVGSVFPDVIYRDPTGQQRSIHQLSGTVSFVYMWASWCPICADDLTNMEWYYKKYKDNAKFSIVALNLLEPYEKGLDWVKRMGGKYTLPFSDSGIAGKPAVATTPCGPFLFPTFTPLFFILDGARKVVHATSSKRNGGNDALQALERTLKTV